MTDPILQSGFPEGAPWMRRGARQLPGISPLPLSDWLLRDDAFAGQMALRDRLIAERPDDVLAMLPKAEPAARECLDAVLAALRSDAGYVVGEDMVTRPDSVTVPIDRDAPLRTIGRLIQSDVCLMEAGQAGHVLTGAVLCFPASWTLAEKIGKPLMAIHGPVPEYDQDLGRRVQRLFDLMRPGQVLTRSNVLSYDDPTLFAPKPEGVTRHISGAAKFVRSERQTLRKLPGSGAVVFCIHTFMVSDDVLGEADRRGMAD